MLGYSLAEPGDGILVSRPMYGRFELDYGVEAGLEVVYADTDPEEAFRPDAVRKYELAVKEAQDRGVHVKAVIIVNPHNPVGKDASLFGFFLPCYLQRHYELKKIRPMLSTGDVEGDP